MAKLINADEWIKEIIEDMITFEGTADEEDKHTQWCNLLINLISKRESVDVHDYGHWMKVDDESVHFRCSNCDYDQYNYRTCFCPNCGAKMI